MPVEPFSKRVHLPEATSNVPLRCIIVDVPPPLPIFKSPPVVFQSPPVLSTTKLQSCIAPEHVMFAFVA